MKENAITPFGAIRQIGILTGDLEQFIETFRATYGLEPTRRATVPTGSAGESQERCQRKIAFYAFPQVELEVIEPVNSGAAWHTFLKRHGDSIHHIQFNVSDLRSACGRMEQCGYPLIERGFSMTNPQVEYVFYDTVEALGYATEIVNFLEIEG